MKLPYWAVGLALFSVASQGLAAQSGTPEASVASATSTSTDSRTLDAARRLANLLNQEQAQVDATLRMIDSSFIPALAADENIKQLENEYPGLLKQLGADLKPIFERHTRRLLPSYVERYAAIYAANFSADELNELYELYASPAGQRMIASMMNNLSMDSLVREAVTKPDAETSLAAVNDDHNRSVRTTVDQLSDEDKQTFAMLMIKPYFPRMLLVAPKLRKLEQEMINEPDPALDAEIEAVIEKSMTAHIAAAEKQK